MACENPTIEISYEPMAFFDRKQVFCRILPFFCIWVSPAIARGEDSASRGLGLFHDYIEPLLKQNCYECHSHEAKKAKGGLVVDSRDAMRKGGDIAPAVVPGDPESSLLIEAVLYQNDDLQMPPDYRLDSDDIAHLKEWIALGAPDPRDGPASVDLGKDKYQAPSKDDLWSVKPLLKSPPPDVDPEGRWVRADVDRFVLAELEKGGLKPSPDATPDRLIRRIHYVLTGLPPTREESLQFEALARERGLEQAMSDRIDQLLGSFQFGERWGRHWLDLARYADVSGDERPKPLMEAWRYRNYIIDAFNTDKPYDRFVKEQLAGDLLDWSSEAERAENLIATGYLALPHALAETRDKEQLKMDTIDEQLDVIGKTFLGVQIGCARCHDHKIDPFPTRDYYSMAGIFRSTIAGPKQRGDNAYVPEEMVPQVEAEVASWLRGPDMNIHGAWESEEIRDEPIHIRGEVHVTGEVVPRGLPSLVSMNRLPNIPSNESGRLALADWILSEENPLSSRVIANRIWQHTFGRGIVRTSDNFGFTGDPPSHPELLDYVARQFRERHHYSFKSMIKELMLSRVWRQSSAIVESSAAVDPDSRLLWRWVPVRKDAEVVIDSVRYVASELNLEPADRTAFKFEAGNQTSTAGLEIPKETMRHRAIYWPIFRKDLPIAMDILPIFNFPMPTAPRGTRQVTRVPSQSLALLNNPVILDAARSLRGHLDRTFPSEPERLEAAYLSVLSRRPFEWERDRLLSFVDSFEQQTVSMEAAKPVNARAVAWNRLCHTLLVSNEFLVID